MRRAIILRPRSSALYARVRSSAVPIRRSACARKIAQGLQRLGVKPGDRVATLAWNTHRHLELYFAVSAIGAVLHTVNPRLFPEQIDYIVNHAGSTIVLFDTTFAALVTSLRPKLAGVRHFVAMTEPAHLPSGLGDCHCYEALLEAEDGTLSWP
jgi:acyl-CoA synthetase (AMP-forming)/AMP-acid ligase II